MADPPKASPKPDIADPFGDTKPTTQTGEFRIVVDTVKKVRRNDRMKTYGLGATLITALLGAGGGKIALNKGESIETKQARQDERTKTLETSVEKLTTRVDAGEKELSEVKSDVKVIKMQQRLMLRALKVDDKLWPKDDK